MDWETEGLRLFVLVFGSRPATHGPVVFFLFTFGVLAMLASPPAFGFNERFMLPQELAVFPVVDFIFSSHNNPVFDLNQIPFSRSHASRVLKAICSKARARLRMEGGVCG
jgi:hypothetical protein